MSTIIKEVELVRKYIKRPEVKKIYNQDKNKYEEHLKSKFKNFSDGKPFLFDMTIDPNKFDYNKLKELCSMIDNVNTGKISQENASKVIGQRYYDKYVKNKVEDVENKVEEIDDNKVEDVENKVEEMDDNKVEEVDDNKVEEVDYNKVEEIENKEESPKPKNEKSRNNLNLEYV